MLDRFAGYPWMSSGHFRVAIEALKQPRLISWKTFYLVLSQENAMECIRDRHSRQQKRQTSAVMIIFEEAMIVTSRKSR